MKTLFIIAVLAGMGCGDAATKSKTDLNNVNTNNTNNSNNTNNTNNGDGFVDMSQFDQTCTYDSECALVEPDVCGCGSCTGVGINTSDVDAFNSARAAIMCDGDPISCPAIECEQTLPSCFQGVCRARTPFFIDAEVYDTACDIDADCIAIFTGDPCASCQCSTAAVSLASYEQNPPPEQQCTPEPPTCDCAPQTNATCNNGTCVIGF